MWWLLGGLVAVIAGLGAVIARRGGSMSGSDLDDRNKAAAETIALHNDHMGSGSGAG